MTSVERPPNEGSSPCVTLVEEGGRRRIPFRDGTLRIGSTAENDVVVDSRSVSRFHAVLTLMAGGEVEIRDLGSLNGTWLEGSRIQSERRRPPFELRIGADTTLAVEELDRDDVSVVAGEDLAIERSRATVRQWEPTQDSGLSRAAAGSPLAAQLLAVLATHPPGWSALRQVLEHALEASEARHGWIVEMGPHVRAEGPRVRCAAGEPRDLPAGVVAEIQRRLLSGVSGGIVSGGASDPELHVRFAAPVGASSPCVVLAGPTEPPESAGVLAMLASRALMGHAQDEAATASPKVSAHFSVAASGAGIVDGTSAAIRQLHARLASVLTSDLPVLLLGPTGVGKEIYAHAIHAQSSRHEGPFRAVNSCALPESLLEASLFGVEEGAASGVHRQKGLLRDAEGGSFFFDEIGDMPLSFQTKLLRVIDQREVLPVGAARPLRVDVRFITATNRDLAAEVAAGRFRLDLYHRLKAHEIRIPALTERREDIATLVMAFQADECARLGRVPGGVTTKALSTLVGHDWPGNVRELEQTIRGVVHSLADGEPIRHVDLPNELRSRPVAPSSGLDARTADFQRGLIADALSDCDANVSRAAQVLGVDRSRLRRLMRSLRM